MSSSQERKEQAALRKRDEQERRAATAAAKAAAKAELNEQKAQLEHGTALVTQQMQNFWRKYKVAPPAEAGQQLAAAQAAPAPLTLAAADVDVAQAS